MDSLCSVIYLRWRLLQFVALLLLVSAGIGRAEAATKAQAYDAAMAQQSGFRTLCRQYYNYQTEPAYSNVNIQQFAVTDEPTQLRFKAFGKCYYNSTFLRDYTSYHAYDVACPTGTNYDRTTNSCLDPRAVCQSYNDGLNGTIVSRTWTSFCPANKCSLELKNSTCTTVAGQSGQMCTGVLEYSGDTCGTPTPTAQDSKGDPEAPRTQECIPVSGQTVCVKSNGDHCYTASTGRQICWGAGETGTKTDGPVIQRRGPGTNAPSAPTPPEGESLNPPTTPVTTTTTTTTNTIITTTTNYTTTNGTNGGPTNGGESSDGSGSGSEGGEEGGTGVTGGVDCNVQPACTDNKEAVGCAILLQTWKQRCAVEGDGLSAANSALNAAGDGLPIAGQGGEEVGTGSGGDTSFMNAPQGWSSRGSCPVDLNIDTQSFGLFHLPETQLCQVLDALAALVLLAGYVAAGFIVLGGQKAV